MRLLPGPPANPHGSPSGGEPEGQAEHVVDDVRALAGAAKRRRPKLNRFDCEWQEGGTDDYEGGRARPGQQCDQDPEWDKQDHVQARCAKSQVIGERSQTDSRDVARCFSAGGKESIGARGQGCGEDDADAHQEKPGNRLPCAQSMPYVPVERRGEEQRDREPRKESWVISKGETVLADHAQCRRARSRIVDSVSTTRSTSPPVMPGQIGSEMARSYSFVATG